MKDRTVPAFKEPGWEGDNNETPHLELVTHIDDKTLYIEVLSGSGRMGRNYYVDIAVTDGGDATWMPFRIGGSALRKLIRALEYAQQHLPL